MRINHNITALNNHRNMTLNNVATGKNMEKLSSGLRINRAGDDAAGLAVSEKMRGQIRGLEQAQRNVQDGISFIQTAEGAMNEISSMLTRMKELNVQYATGTYTTTQKADSIEVELTNLSNQIDSILQNTKFNGISISGGTVSIQADDNSVKIGIAGITTSNIQGLAGATSISTIETAIETVAKERAKLGAMQNRLEYTSNNLGTTIENLTASESRIRDTDMAKEMVELTKNQILLQSSQAMLAQANSAPQGVLSLLR
ncbi:flagellin [Cohnella sp. LGH]|uniref:Flagellin n=1 Tax=Cohnella phaseoli TaxID=456490 RepID=A0A3D9KCJ1_9BACL|nr:MULTISPECIES: flagellin [Cohnella]QTH42291.1 flagellin [Cohnella sp. LGH]RED83992.1 flagellin [Cohnella phaseoli]